MSRLLPPTMSEIEALDELAGDIREAYEEEIGFRDETGANHDSMGLSIRDLDQTDDLPALDAVNRLDLLESWQSLVQALYSHQVFLQYTPALERLFLHMNFFDESKWLHVKILIDLMTETVENQDKDVSTECRYVTLLEVVTSYGSNWEVSHQVEHLWNGVNHEAHPGMFPDEFRNAAYEVLMSLSWVPSSQGLRAACSIKEDDATDAEVPLVVQSIFCQIRATPLPRHDCMHRLLNRLNEGTNATVAISSPVDDSFRTSSRKGQGLGKTTLAAMLASLPQVQSKYCVLWLRLNHVRDASGMTYRQYVKYLNSLCEQLGIEPVWPQPMRALEERALQLKRDDEKMFQVKREMSDLLESKMKDVLLILDDVVDDQEIEWFWFLEEQSILVTTRAQNLSVHWTLELEALSEEEALDLFLAEADFPPNHVLSTSLEAKSIVQRCGYHPLTIRTAARWFRLKEVTAGVVKALEELDQELSACTAKLRHSRHSTANPPKVLIEVMNLMLSPVLAAGGQPTTLMKMCLSSMAVVFDEQVPLEAVHLLWAELLRTEPDAIDELGDSLSSSQLRKRVRFISEALTSLGLLSITEKDDNSYVEIHHELQKEYALSLARDMHFTSSNGETVQRWHEAFAAAYLVKKVESDRDGFEDNCRAYAIQRLVSHMIQADMLQKVVALLKDDRFFGERVALKGLVKGTEIHLNDCKELQVAMEKDENITANPREVAASIYSKIASFLVAGAQGKDETTWMEIGKALNDIGFAFAVNRCFTEALAQYRTALKLVPKSSHIAATLLYNTSCIYLARNDHLDKGLKNVKECLKILLSIGKSSVLYPEALQLKGDILIAHCDYQGAMEAYEKALERLYTDSSNHRVEIGVICCRKGRLHQVMGETRMAITVLNESVDIKLKMGESSRSLATAYNFLGDIYVEADRCQEAVSHFEKAIRLFEANHDDVDAVDLHLVKGKLFDLRGDYGGCQQAFENALKCLRATPRMLMDRAAYDLRWIARTYMHHGDLGRALPVFQECLAQTEDRPDSLERAAALFDLGGFYLKRDDTKNALNSFEQSLAIRIKKLSEGETVIQTLEMIGGVHKSIGDIEMALSFHNKALELTERTFGEDNERAASALFALGELKEAMNDDLDALVMYSECLEVRRRNLTHHHPDIANTLEKLGSIQCKRGNYDKAYQCYAEALDIRQASFDPDDPRLGNTFHEMGVVARKRGDCERGLHFLLDALHIRTKLQAQHETCQTLLEIGHVHRQVRDPESAESAVGCYEKCLELLFEHFGDQDDKVGDAYHSLGHALKDLGKVSRAMECYDRALAARSEMYGTEHRKTSVVYRSIGITKFQMNQQEDAMKYLGDFVRIQDANKTKGTVDYVLALLIIGDIHRYFLNAQDANSVWSAAFHSYSQSKEITSKYPDIGLMLERRLASLDDAPPASGFFQRISADFVGRLSDEVKTRAGGMERDPAEDEVVNAIFLDD